MPVMPDILGMTEEDAQAALRGVSIRGGRQIIVWPGNWDGGSDADYLGEGDTGGDDSWQYAASVTADGTISYQQPAPGETFTDAAELGIDVWGVHNDADTTAQIAVVALEEWEVEPFHGLVEPPLTDGGWVEDGTSSFRIQLTTLHRPSTPAVVLTHPEDDSIDEVTQFSNPKLKETLSEPVEFSFEMSMHDPMVQHVVKADVSALPEEYELPDGYEPNGAYAFAARVYYRNQVRPVFWAPCTYEKKFGEAKVIVSGVDRIRAQKHFLRFGDPVLDIVGDDGVRDEGLVTVDHQGVHDVWLAARNTPEQDDRDVPALGFYVHREAGAPDRSAKYGLERSHEVWDAAKSILDDVLGPDAWMDFRDDKPGFYGALRIYGKRGSDRTATVRFFYGVDGEDDNTADIGATPITPITHAHVVAQDATQIRETDADALESYLRGVFVTWTALDINTKRKSETVIREALQALAEAHVAAYANAPEAVGITLRPDAGQDRFYGEHYWVGDTIYYAAEKGYVSSAGDLRIRGVEISEQGSRGATVTKLEVSVDKTSDGAGEEA